MSKAKPQNRRRIVWRITSAESGNRVSVERRDDVVKLPLASRSDRNVSPADRALILPSNSLRA